MLRTDDKINRKIQKKWIEKYSTAAEGCTDKGMQVAHKAQRGQRYSATIKSFTSTATRIKVLKHN